MSTSGEESTNPNLGSPTDNRNNKNTSSHIKGSGSSSGFSQHGSLEEAHHLPGHCPATHISQDAILNVLEELRGEVYK